MKTVINVNKNSIFEGNFSMQSDLNNDTIILISPYFNFNLNCGQIKIQLQTETHRCGSWGAWLPPPLITFWLSLVVKDRDTLIEQSITLIEESFALIEQSSLLIINSCSSVSLVMNVAADFDSCEMARAGGYDLFFLSST